MFLFSEALRVASSSTPLNVLHLPVYTYLRYNAGSFMSDDHGLLHDEVGDAHVLEIVHVAPTDAHGSHLNGSRITPPRKKTFDVCEIAPTLDIIYRGKVGIIAETGKQSLRQEASGNNTALMIFPKTKHRSINTPRSPIATVSSGDCK